MKDPAMTPEEAADAARLELHAVPVPVGSWHHWHQIRENTRIWMDSDGSRWIQMDSVSNSDWIFDVQVVASKSSTNSDFKK